MTDEQNTPRTAQKQDRLERLTRRDPEETQISRRYSYFIRSLRLLLPVIALIMIGVVFMWDEMADEELIAPQAQTQTQQNIGKNELLNPRFESTDEKEQPYTITAKRALQGVSETDDLIVLEDPVADMLLNSGHWVAIEAKQGAFEQKEQKLLLRGEVSLYHDEGYQLDTEQLHVDMKQRVAWSDVNVYAQGPAGTLEATGLYGRSENGHLIFHGPAKLVLNNSASNQNIGEIFAP